jgi:hypothetical protein
MLHACMLQVGQPAPAAELPQGWAKGAPLQAAAKLVQLQVGSPRPAPPAASGSRGHGRIPKRALLL